MPTSVRDVMTTNVISFTREESVTDGMQRLLDANVSGGPVVDGENKVVGMLTDSDLIVQDAQLHAPTAIAILGTVISLPKARREFEEELRSRSTPTPPSRTPRRSCTTRTCRGFPSSTTRVAWSV